MAKVTIVIDVSASLFRPSLAVAVDFLYQIRGKNSFPGPWNSMDPERTIFTFNPVVPFGSAKNPATSLRLVLLVGSMMEGRWISNLKPFEHFMTLSL